jgi:hypothetical protein
MKRVFGEINIFKNILDMLTFLHMPTSASIVVYVGDEIS